MSLLHQERSLWSCPPHGPPAPPSGSRGYAAGLPPHAEPPSQLRPPYLSPPVRGDGLEPHYLTRPRSFGPVVWNPRGSCPPSGHDLFHVRIPHLSSSFSGDGHESHYHHDRRHRSTPTCTAGPAQRPRSLPRPHPHPRPLPLPPLHHPRLLGPPRRPHAAVELPFSARQSRRRMTQGARPPWSPVNGLPSSRPSTRLRALCSLQTPTDLPWCPLEEHATACLSGPHAPLTGPCCCSRLHGTLS
jgi:hypothetical protein